jgi:hypothetical protein
MAVRHLRFERGEIKKLVSLLSYFLVIGVKIGYLGAQNYEVSESFFK